MNKHIIIISPRTYNLHEKIIKGAKANGFTVHWYSDRLKTSFINKTLGRYFNKLSRSLFKKRYLEKFKSLEKKKLIINHILVIKGECIHPDIIKYLRNTYRNAKFILYYWDSASLIPGYNILPPLFDKCYTFDYKNSVEYKWYYQPLFSSNSITSISNDKKEKMPKILISFVGVLNSERIKVASNINKELNLNHCINKKNILFYFYSPTIFHKILSYLYMPKFTHLLSKNIYNKPLNEDEISNIYINSDCILDISHPEQIGISMRTFEALLSNKKLVTTNSFVKKLKIYHPTRICVIDRDKPQIPSEFLNSNFKELKSEERNQLSPSYWVNKVLNS